MKAKTIAMLVVVGLFVILVLWNMHQVRFNLYFWPIEMPLIVLILSSVFLGVVVGWFSHVAYQGGKQKSKSPKTEPIVEPKEKA
jgi:uncharacterized integral membrane protein